MGSDFTRPYQSRVKDRTAFIKHNFRFGAEKFVFIIMARRIGTYHATTAKKSVFMLPYSFLHVEVAERLVGMVSFVLYFEPEQQQRDNHLKQSI